MPPIPKRPPIPKKPVTVAPVPSPSSNGAVPSGGHKSATNDTDLAYIAGIVDGEGCIRIKKSNPNPGIRVTPGYHAAIQIRMVDESAISFIQQVLGGSYYKESAPAPNRRPLFLYAAQNLIAERVLRKILPFLKVKRKQAELVLSLVELKRTSTRHRTKFTGYKDWPNLYTNRRVPVFVLSDEYIDQCEAMFLACKELNKVGAREE